MSIVKLDNILKVFRGGETSAEEDRQLVREALLMTLARASRADIDIDPVEVETVRKAIREATGDDVSAEDVRLAAHSELYETTSLTHYLSKISHKLRAKDRAMIANGLAEVIKSDSQISWREVEFFDKVAEALKLKPSEITGLIPEES